MIRTVSVIPQGMLGKERPRDLEPDDLSTLALDFAHAERDYGVDTPTINEKILIDNPRRWLTSGELP